MLFSGFIEYYIINEKGKKENIYGLADCLMLANIGFID